MHSACSPVTGVFDRPQKSRARAFLLTQQSLFRTFGKSTLQLTAGASFLLTSAALSVAGSFRFRGDRKGLELGNQLLRKHLRDLRKRALVRRGSRTGRAVTEATWQACRKRFAGMPILVDYHHRKQPDFFTGATVLKASGPSAHVDDIRGALQRVAEWQRQIDLQAAVITLGELGAVLATRAGTEFVPGFRTVVKDACGAGDAFLAGLGLAVIEGRNWSTAAEQANALAARKVQRGRSFPRHELPFGATA